MAARVQFKYKAFLGYSHRDRSWGQWIHHAIEGYRVDKKLIGQETRAGQHSHGLIKERAKLTKIGNGRVKLLVL